MSYGEKIANLRKQKGITQAALGYHLNVTYQAVSKWERDESDPDFATMNKIAKYFDVPLSYFTEEIAAPPSTGETAVVADNTVSAASAPPSSAAPNPAQPVQPAQPTKPQNQKFTKPKSKHSAPMRRNVGLIVGGVSALAVLITLIVVFSLDGSTDWALGAAACGVATLFAFTFITQLFWGGVIIDIILWGFKIIGTPGIIFSFDLDGFIFLIAMKILFAFIKIIGLFLFMFLALIFAIIASPFTFIPQLVAINKDEL